MGKSARNARSTAETVRRRKAASVCFGFPGLRVSFLWSRAAVREHSAVPQRRTALMKDSAEPGPSEASLHRRRAATLAYVVVAILIGWAIAREFVRVQKGKPTAAVTAETMGEGLV